jgi:hypothetical protein
MRILIDVLAVWFSLNLAIPAFIVWQRSPHFRHRVFRLTLGAFVPRQTQFAHTLFIAAHHRH